MNKSMIRYILGYLLRIEAFFLMLPAVTGFIYREKEARSFLVTAVLTLILGVLLTLK